MADYKDNIEKLYRTLESQGYTDIGTPDQFRTYVSDSANVSKLHQALDKAGYTDIGTPEQFSKWLNPDGYGTKPKPAQQKPQEYQQPVTHSGDTMTHNGQPYSQEVLAAYNSPDNTGENYRDLATIANEMEGRGVQRPASTPAAKPVVEKPFMSKRNPAPFTEESPSPIAPEKYQMPLMFKDKAEEAQAMKQAPNLTQGWVNRQAEAQRMAANPASEPDFGKRMEAQQKATEVENARKANRRDFDQQNFDKLYDEHVSPVLAEERKEADKRAQEAYEKSKEEDRQAGTFNMPTGHAGFGKAFETNVLNEKYTDPEKIANETLKRVQEDDSFGDYILSRMGINDNGNDGGDSPQLSEREKELMKLLFGQETQEVAGQIIRRIYDTYQAENAPKSTMQYIAGKAFRENMVAQLYDAMVRRAANSSGMREQLRAMAYDAYGKDQSWWTRMAGGAAPFAVDMIAGGFTLPNIVGQAVSKGGTRLAARELVNQMKDRAIARGLKGTALKEAVKGGGEVAERYIATQAPILNLALRSAGSAANFATYDVQSEAIRQMANGEFKPYDIAKAAVHGALLGGAMGAAGGTISQATRNASLLGKVAGEAAGIGTETAIFGLSSGLQKAIDQGIDIQDVDWADTTGEAFGMVVGMKTVGAAMHPREFLNRYRKSKDYDLQLNQHDLDELKAAGYDLDGIFKGLGKFGEIKPMEGKTLDKAKEITIGSYGKEADTEEAWVDADNYKAILENPEISTNAKRKIVYLATGNILMPEPVFGATLDVDDKGHATITTTNAYGAPIETKDYKNEEEAREAYEKLQQVSRTNTVGGLERIAQEAGMPDVVDIAKGRTREETDIDVDDLERLSELNKEDVDRVLDTYIKNLQDVYMEHFNAKMQRLEESAAERPSGTAGGEGPISEGYSPIREGYSEISEGSSAAGGTSPSADVVARREAAYNRGMSVAEDTSVLPGISYDQKLGKARVMSQFEGADPRVARAANEVMQAIENGDDELADRLMQQNGSSFTPSQAEAIEQYRDAVEAQRGVEDAITQQTDAFVQQRSQELQEIADPQGMITELQTKEGYVYYKAGDLNNQFGSLYVVTHDGETKQIPTSSVISVVGKSSVNEVLDMEINEFADNLKAQYDGIANGSILNQGQQVDMVMSGQGFTATVAGNDAAGNVILQLEDGSQMPMRPEEVQQAIETANDLKMAQQLKSERDAARLAEQQQRFAQGIKGYSEGQINLGAAETDPAVAAEYLMTRFAAMENPEKARKQYLTDLQARKDQMKQWQDDAAQHLSRLNLWLQANEDIEEPQAVEKAKHDIAVLEQNIALYQQKQQKFGEIRRNLMTPEEVTQMEQQRGKEVFKARSGYQPQLPQRNLSTNEDRITLEDGQPNFGLTSAANVNNYLLKNFPDSPEAEQFINAQRIALRNKQRDEVQNEINQLNATLNAYTAGTLELTPDEVKQTAQRLADLEAYQDALSKEAVNLRQIAEGIPALYERNGRTEELTPAGQRSKALEKATSREDKLRIARDIYNGYPEALDIINDQEPRDIEEYIAQNLPLGKLNWEGYTDASGRRHVGVQGAVFGDKNATRGIGKQYATNAFNQYLAPTGEGMSFDDMVHMLYEAGPESGDSKIYDDTQIAEALGDMLRTAQKPSDISHRLIDNRIAEAEDIVEREEEYEREMEEQAKLEEMQEWADAHHLTPEERETFEEFMKQPPTDIEQEIINQIIAENEEQNRRGQEVDLDNTSGAAGRDSQTGEVEVQTEGSADATGGNPQQQSLEGAEIDTEMSPVFDSDVAGGAPRVDTPLGRSERAKQVVQAIEDLRKQYNSAPIVYAEIDMNDRDLVAAYPFIPGMEEALDEANEEDLAWAADHIRQHITNTKSYSVFNPVSKKIVIFASQIPEGLEKRSFFHENIHSVLDMWYGQGDKLIASNFWKNAPEEGGKLSKQFIRDRYTQPEWEEEFFTSWLGRSMTDNTIDSLRQHLDDGDLQRLDNILKEINYVENGGESETGDNRPAPEGGNDGGGNQGSGEIRNADGTSSSGSTGQPVQNKGSEGTGKYEREQAGVSKGEDLLHVPFADRLNAAKAETYPNPTEAQKKAGNYPMGHIRFGGYRMSIENPKGSTRSGVDQNGKPWSIEMKDTYGYIGKKYGTDGDHLDYFINDDADLDAFEGRVYVVDQKNEDGSFDEHKVMYGYPSWSAARRAYERNYEPGWWDKHVMQMIGVKKEDFDKWLNDSDHKTKPFADYYRTKISDTVSDPVDQMLADVEDREAMAKQREADLETIRKGMEGKPALPEKIREEVEEMLLADLQMKRPGTHIPTMRLLNQLAKVTLNKLQSLSDQELKDALDAVSNFDNSTPQSAIAMEMERREELEGAKEEALLEVEKIKQDRVTPTPPSWSDKEISESDTERLQQLRHKAEEDLDVNLTLLATNSRIKPEGKKGKQVIANIMQAQADIEAINKELAKRTKQSQVEDVEAGGAMIDHLQDMGIDVEDNISEIRKAKKKGDNDNSEEGRMRKMTTSDGKVYGFAYRGKLYLDPRKLDANLPLHEYGHLWCEAFRRLNPEGWKEVVSLMKQDPDTWKFIKDMNPDLTNEDDIAEEMIAKGSGDNGKQRIMEEYARMSQRDPSYKSKWGNIWKNISKALQDFWKKVGDFLHIKYESPRQVYDQVLRDFANGVNPRKKVEEFLKKRDADYMQAAESGDTKRAAEIFSEALKENVGNGMTPFVAVDNYRKLQQTARKIKKGDQAAIDKAAEMMAPLIPDNAVLVPVPSHEGKATDMLQLANAIASRTGSEVADILTGTPRKSQYENKKEGGKALTSSELGITKNGNLPEGKIPVVIDNVVDSGNTAEACIKALGTGMVASLADSANKSSHAATLKSAEPIVLDKDGKVIPLSKRFDLTSGKYLGKKADAIDRIMEEVERRQDAAEELQGRQEVQASIETAEQERRLTNEQQAVRQRSTNAVVKVIDDAGVPIKQVSQKEADQMMELFTAMNQQVIANYAREQRPNEMKRYAVINIRDPYGVPFYFEKRQYARESKAQLNRYGGKFEIFDLDAGREQNELRQAADIMPQIDVWHGSGAVFTKFDHSHMGEGAGSQSFGWGTYLSNGRNIGEDYAKISSRGWTYKGKNENQLFTDAKNEPLDEGSYYTDGEVAAMVLSRLNQKEPLDVAIERVRMQTLTSIWDHEAHLDELSPAELKDLEGFRKELAFINSLKPEDFAKPEQHLYKVDIPDENEAYYIDYQGKMGNQNDILDMVDNALTADGWKRQEIDSRVKFTKGSKQIILTPNQSGADLYAELEDALGSDKAASEFLHKTGITGMKYPAGTIMGGGNGATNYVVFNEDDAKIVQHIQFMIDDGAQPENPVFYSNAMRAVEGIKQEKATPEQWLKMIEKAGGIKAGEEKWLELGAWLKSATVKTLTKQQIIDFINEFQIQIEETQYSQFNDKHKLADFNNEFNSILEKYKKDSDAVQAEIETFDQEMYEKYGQGWANDFKKLSKEDLQRNRDISKRYSFLNDNDLDQLAFADMVEKYGDDFGDAFEVYYNRNGYELIPALDYSDEPTAAAKHFLQTTDLINGTRLSYTTEGLDNKREIALTVPTIDPYNTHDDIHFGDAGGGRAVAWVRFGDAYFNKDSQPQKIDEQWDAFMTKMAEKYGKDRKDTLGLLTSMTDEERETMNKLDREITKKEKSNMGRVLVIDEIQSKRHQDARERGYQSAVKAEAEREKDDIIRKHDELVAKRDELIDRDLKRRDEIRESKEGQALIGDDGYIKDGKVEEYQALFENDKELNDIQAEKQPIVRQILEIEQDMHRINDAYGDSVPDAPFEKNWHELAMKRMLRYAAENGYDKIAWTKGAQQAERYDLGGKVKRISSFEPDDYAKENGEFRNVQIDFLDGQDSIFINIDKDGNVMSSDFSELQGKHLSEALGKDLANKIMNDEAGKTYEGEDLLLGGQGMKGFYDEILPRFMNKYGKKWGVKVGEIDLPDLEKSAQKMWSIDVTPEMKESVMQGQPMFQKGQGGKIYGWTDGTGIFLTPLGMNPNSPMHEYTHIWDMYIQKSDQKLWKEMVATFKKTQMWQQIRENPNYRSIWDDDNRMASEVHSRLTGARSEEEFEKAAADPNNNDTESIIRQVKDVIRKFWEKIASLFGYGKDRLEEFVLMPLRDVLNGFNPIDGSRTANFAEAMAGKIAERTLMGAHNISEEKLRKAIKQGGLANPSLAVIDTNKGIHTSYGDISLIPKASLIDAKTGRNAGTYAGDAYTPTYPYVERMATKQGEKSIERIAKEAAGGDEELERHLRSNLFDYAEGNAQRLHLLYLLQKGMNPEIKQERTSHSKEEFDAITKIFGEPKSTMPSDLTKEQSDALVDLMTTLYEKGLRDNAKNIKDNEKVESFIKGRVEAYRKNITDENGRIWFADGDNFVHGNWRDEQKRNNPKPDWYSTDNEASYRIAKDGLSEDYEKWKEEQLFSDGDFEEKLFAGYDRNGNRKYVPNTVENASRLMNKEADTNAYDQHGLNATKSSLLKRMTTLSDIRKAKHLLQGEEVYNETQKEMSDELFDIIHQLSDMKKISDNSFSNIDYAEARLQEAITKRDPIGYLNREYGYDIAKDGEYAAQLMNFIEKAKELPAKYFETKFKRPVGLSEFAIAVVPENTSPDIVEALKNAGLDVRTYDNTGEMEAQNESRRQAVMDAVSSRNDILFHIADPEESERLENSQAQQTFSPMRSVKKEAARLRRFHDMVDDMFNNPNFDKSSHIHEQYDLGDTPEYMKKLGIKGEYFTLSFKNIKTHQGKDEDHNLTAKEWHAIPVAIKNPFLITTYGDNKDKFRLYTTVKVGNKFAVVGIDVVRKNMGKNIPMLELNRIKTVFGRDRYVMENGEKILAWNKNITPEQEAVLRGHNFRIYPTIQELSGAKIENYSGTSKENAEKISAAASKTGDLLGGTKVKTVTYDDADATEKREIENGTLGIFDPNSGDVTLFLDNIENVEEAKRTVCHEKLGHEGLVALMGDQAKVNEFGEFIFDSANGDVYKRIYDKANEIDPYWEDNQRYSKAAQEVFADIAADGPRTANEFSLWRKVKHYLIRLLKSMNIRIKGLLNDHDLAYYILKTGEALKRWNQMTPEEQQEAARQDTEFDIMRSSRRGKPRKRNNESMAQYMQRLREWEMWKQAEERAAENNDPMPDAEQINERWHEQYNADMRAWREANGIAEGTENAGEFPKRERDESPQEYAARVADYETLQDTFRGAPSLFDYLQRANEEYREAYAAWKERYGIREEENVDLGLYEGDPERMPHIVDYDDFEADTSAEASLVEAVGIDMSSEGARRHTKLSVIERRKNLESANAEDAIWIHNLVKAINAEAKRQGVEPKELREAMADIIEGTYFEDVIKDEHGNVLSIEDISDQLPIKMTDGLKDILDTIKDWYDYFFHALEDAGLRRDAGYIEEGYVNHVWDRQKTNPEIWKKYVDNFQRTKSPNMKERVIETYRMGRDIGLVPKFKDIADILAYYSSSNNQAIANKKFLDSLSFVVVEEKNTDGEVVSILPLLNSDKPNIVVADRYDMYKVPGVGPVWVLKDIQRTFANIFGTMRTGDIPEWLTKTGKVYDTVSSTAKKIELSFSAFHMGALTEVAMAQMRPDRAMRALGQYIILDCAKSGTIPAYAHPEDFKLAASHLVQLGATQDYSASDVNNVTEKLREIVRELANEENLAKKGAGMAATPIAAALDYINKGMDKVLWNYLHDGLKIACFKMFAEQIEKRVEKEALTPEQREQLLDEAGQYVNDTFGGQYWELLNVSPALIKWLRRAFLSPDWLISTQRHFLANFGFGSLYSESGFLNYLRYNADNIKRAFGADIPRNENRRFRSKNAKQCYLLGVCGFFYVMMNAINALFRAQDEEKEKEKADEMRKENPDYKSPYELAYPDGMKWYDYTMYGNTLGQQTHLFLGRYDDGTEWYARWGKQFREFPELFMGRHGVEFPTPLMERMSGKANPIGRYLMYDLPLTVGMYGYNQPRETKEIADKYGNTVALLAMTAKKFVPYSVPTQEDKEFKMFDLVMPSQKGFTRWKAVDFFKTYIQAGDMDGIERTYNAAVMNGLDAEAALKAAIATVKATQRKELADGIVDLPSAMERYDATQDVQEKKRLRQKIYGYLAEQEYRAFTRDEAIEQVEAFMNGEQQTDNDINRYVKLARSTDVRDEYRLEKIRKQAKKFVDEVKTAEGDRQRRLRDHYDAWFRIDGIIKNANTQINRLKKQLGKEGSDDAATMQQIRTIRTQAQQEVDKVQAP